MDINNLSYTQKVQSFQGNQPTQTTSAATQPIQSQPATAGISSEAASSLKANATVSTPIGYKSLGIKKMPYVGDANVFQLNNGQKVVIVPKKGPTVIKTFVKVGSMNEPDNIRGISHYIEHNLFNGSQNIAPKEFVQKVNDMGSNYNASTGFTTTSYFIKTPLHGEQDLEKSLKLHSDLLLNPLFLENQLDKERGPVTSEISMVEDNPENIGVNTVLKDLFQIKSKSTDLTAGSVENIKNVTKQDVLNYYNTWYTPDNMTTVIVGDVDVNKTMGLISRDFNVTRKAQNNKNYEKLTPIAAATRKDIKNPNTSSTILNLALSGPENGNAKDALAVEAVNTVLSGSQNARLSKALEQYDTDGGFSLETVGGNQTDPQSNILQVKFNPDVDENGLKTVYDTVNELKSKPITDDELRVVKNKMKLSLEESSEHSMSVCSLIGNSMLDSGSLENYEKSVEMIDSLTTDDLKNAVNKYFDLNKAAVVMVHPQNTDFNSATQKYDAVNGKKNIAFAGHSQIANISNSTKSVLPDYKQFDLNNNLRVTLNKADSPICASTIEFTKDNEVPVKDGVADLLSIMLNEGTALHSKEEYTKLADDNGVSVNFIATPRKLVAGINNDTEHQDLAMNMAKEGLMNPSLTQEKLDKAKSEIKMAYLSSQKDANDNASEILYPNNYRGNSIRKTVANLDNITLQDVQSLYGGLTKDMKANATISAQKTTDPQFQNSVFTSLSTLPPAQKFAYVNNFSDKPLDKTVVITQPDERKQAHIAQVFKIEDSGNVQDEATLKVLNYILGGSSNSRLFNDLREQQKLAYTVKSHYETDGKAATLGLDIKTTTDNPSEGPEAYKNLQKSLDGFKKHINLLCNQPVSEKELENAKLNLKSSLIFASETADGKTAMLRAGINTQYGPEYIKEYLNAIDNVSAEDIQKSANKYLKQPSVVSVVASQSTLDKNKDYLSTIA